MSTTQTYTIRSPLLTPTSGSGSIPLSPSLATATSLSTSSSMVSPSISTSTSTSTAPRVRFDAECVLIPELGSFNPKRPRMVTKSYSLPLWKKNTRDEEDEQHVVLKVALPSFKSRKSSSRSRERNASRSPPAASPPLPSCLRSPSITSASAAISSPPEATPSPTASFGSLGVENASPTPTSPPKTSDASSPTPTPSCDTSPASPFSSPNADSAGAGEEHMNPALPTPTISTSTNAHLGRAKSASTSAPTAPPPSTPPVVAAPAPGGQIPARVSSVKGKRTRSSSSSSAGKSGSQAFGPLADVLKGVTSISSA
ncbi:hypothetical protein K438DRAFT_1969398 [Mycena galopus ATCC 62051]|nr:hypothetical protein K438DRAFT_1969398 [Mycena galopus ATCC 62051]